MWPGGGGERSAALPRVQADVMVVAARGDECGLVPQPLLQLESEHAGVERERAIDVRHLQMDVADVDARIDRAHPATIPGLGIAMPWREPPGGDVLALRRRPARERDLLPLLRAPHRSACSGAARGADRHPARGDPVLRARDRRCSSSVSCSRCSSLGIVLVVLGALVVGVICDRPRSLSRPDISRRLRGAGPRRGSHARA